MLTADLVMARLYKGEIKPRYLDPAGEEPLALAEQLIELFAAHEGRTRGELEAALAELRGTDTEFLVHRGLAKLLFDRTTVESAAQAPPEELRAKVFALAAGRWRAQAAQEEFRGEEVLREVGAELGYGPEVIARWLYADLKDEQTVNAFEVCTPEWLLHRYNVALAQGVLLRATELTIHWPAADPRATRELFRRIKFFQLLHRLERADDGGWRIVLDGPLSVFQASGKYGVAMASFLPTLLHFDGWSLEAEVRFKKDRGGTQSFKLSPGQGLRSHTRLSGQWQPEELSWLPGELAALDEQWEVEDDAELIELGGAGVLVPDFVFRHRRSGVKVYMEVFGFWRRGALKSRLDQLRKHGPKKLILAISKALAAEHEDLEEVPAEVYVYRTQPLARQVLARLKTFT
jgi:predicted nuclease of restriction endonuclease-like RecB superfamily